MKKIIPVLLIIFYACGPQGNPVLYPAETTAPTHVLSSAPDSLSVKEEMVPVTANVPQDDSLPAKKKRQKQVPVHIIDVAASTSEDFYKTPDAIITSTFTKRDEKIFFTYYYLQPETRGIGCSGGSTRLEFAVTDSLTSFTYHDHEVNALIIEYKVIGGIWSEEFKDVKKGFIKGRQNDDKSWTIVVNLHLNTINIMLEPDSDQIAFDTIFIN